MRLLLLVIATAGLLLMPATVLPPAPAAAHVELRSAEVAGQAGGRELVLAFSSSVAPGFSTIRVFDDAGKPVLTDQAVRDPADGRRVRLPLGGLGPGTYTASYRVVAQDGHVLAGGAAFTIPGGATTTTQTPPSTSPTPNTWDAADVHVSVTGAAGGGSGPSELLLEFPGALLPDGNAAQVLTTGRKVVVPGPGRVGANPGTLSLSLEGLAPGWYTVSWRVVGKARTGSVSEAVFEVQATRTPATGVGGGATAGSDRPDRVAKAAQMPLRALGFVGAALLGGSMVFGLAVWRPTALRDPALAAADRALAGRLRRTAVAGAALVLLATPPFLLTEAADAADVSLVRALGGPVWRFVGTTTGQVDVARIVLAAAALGLAALLPARLTGTAPRRWWTLLALGAALLLTFSLTSHASTSQPAPVNVLVDWIHLSAMAGWVGGLVGLALARSSRLPDGRGRRRLLARGGAAVLHRGRHRRGRDGGHRSLRHAGERRGHPRPGHLQLRADPADQALVRGRPGQPRRRQPLLPHPPTGGAGRRRGAALDRRAGDRPGGDRPGGGGRADHPLARVMPRSHPLARVMPGEPRGTLRLPAVTTLSL